MTKVNLPYKITSPYTNPEDTLTHMVVEHLPMDCFPYGGSLVYKISQTPGEREAELGLCLTQTYYQPYKRIAAEAINQEAEEIRDSYGGSRERLEAAIYKVKMGSAYDYGDSPDYLCHTAYASVIMRKAVCQGFCTHLVMLLNKVGIPSYSYVLQTGSGHKHVVTKFFMEGQWHYVDVTLME